jgi:CheY-like chemotaxis protein
MSRDGSAKTLLCVDADENAMAIRRRVLEAAGYKVLSVATGEAAIAHLSAGDIDAVILDYQMPGTDGGKLAERIRTHSTVPILIYGSDPYPPDAVRKNIARWLQKIEGPAALLDALARLLPDRSDAQ